MKHGQCSSGGRVEPVEVQKAAGGIMFHTCRSKSIEWLLRLEQALARGTSLKGYYAPASDPDERRVTQKFLISPSLLASREILSGLDQGVEHDRSCMEKYLVFINHEIY